MGKVKFTSDIDKLINDRVINIWNMERRDYYKLREENPDMFKNRPLSCDYIMYLGEVDYDHYTDIFLYDTGIVKMVLRRDDTTIISMTSDRFDKDINSLLSIFLGSIDDYMRLINIFSNLNRGIIPIDMRRNLRIDNIFNEEI